MKRNILIFFFISLTINNSYARGLGGDPTFVFLIVGALLMFAVLYYIGKGIDPNADKAESVILGFLVSVFTFVGVVLVERDDIKGFFILIPLSYLLYKKLNKKNDVNVVKIQEKIPSNGNYLTSTPLQQVPTIKVKCVPQVISIKKLDLTPIVESIKIGGKEDLYESKASNLDQDENTLILIVEKILNDSISQRIFKEIKGQIERDMLLWYACNTETKNELSSTEILYRNARGKFLFQNLNYLTNTWVTRKELNIQVNLRLKATSVEAKKLAFTS